MDYWKECITEAFEDAGIIVTEDQLITVVCWVEGAHENYSMACGYDCIPNPVVDENSKLKAELALEREKIVCPECQGRGGEMTYGGTFQSFNTCSKCHGRGIRKR